MSDSKQRKIEVGKQAVPALQAQGRDSHLSELMDSSC